MGKPKKVSVYARMAQAPRAWLYGRVAAADAFALRVQQEHLENYAANHGYVIAGATFEQASGTTTFRPGLNEVSGAVKKGLMDVLLVKDLGRIGRDSQELIDYFDWLDKHGVEVICTEGTASVKDVVEITRNVLASLSAPASK